MFKLILLIGHFARVESIWSTKGAPICASNMSQGKESSVHQNIASEQLLRSMDSGIGTLSSSEEVIAERAGINMKKRNSLETTKESSQQSVPPTVNYLNISRQKTQENSSVQNAQSSQSSTVFKGKTFRFSNFFPQDRVSCELSMRCSNFII